MQLTDQSLDTPRLLASRMLPEHLADVKTVLAKNLDVLQLLWETVDINYEAQRMVTHTDVPPDGLSENNRNYLLQTHAGDLVGVLCSCLFFPTRESSYIGSLYLCPGYRRQGIGREIVQAWYAVVQGKGITETRVYAGLKNWPALRFWISMGYDRLSRVSGDENYAADQFAGIELCRSVDSAIA